MSQDLYQAFMVMINFAALVVAIIALVKKQQLKKAIQWLGRLLSNSKNYERAISLPRMSAVSFYAHYITENGKDKFLIVPFSVFFYLLFYLEMNESISLYRFPCNSAAFEPSSWCL